MTAAPIRYVACHPGALVHQDHKKLGRIPDGGGWRALGRDGDPARTGDAAVGYEHLEVVVDDASRYAVVVPVPDETAASRRSRALEVAAAEFAAVGIRIERVLTDNGGRIPCRRLSRRRRRRLGARHKRTRPFRPQTNGKAERFIQTLINEWAYGRLVPTNDERSAALPGFVDFYNRRRPHTALGGRSPLDAVNNVREGRRLAIGELVAADRVGVRAAGAGQALRDQLERRGGADERRHRAGQGRGLGTRIRPAGTRNAGQSASSSAARTPAARTPTRPAAAIACWARAERAARPARSPVAIARRRSRRKTFLQRARRRRPLLFLCSPRPRIGPHLPGGDKNPPPGPDPPLGKSRADLLLRANPKGK